MLVAILPACFFLGLGYYAMCFKVISLFWTATVGCVALLINMGVSGSRMLDTLSFLTTWASLFFGIYLFAQHFFH